MSDKYKICKGDDAYFVTFTIIDWIKVLALIVNSARAPSARKQEGDIEVAEVLLKRIGPGLPG